MSEHDPAKATAREDLCRFLAACYYEPTEDYREERLFDSMLTAAGQLHPELAGHARKLAAEFAGQELQALLIDYTRLFLGPVQALAMPYGSRWQTGEAALMQESTVAVLDLYEEGGFEVGEDFHDLPDHIAVELEFLYLLLFNRHEAQRDGDNGALAATLALERRFLRQHLAAWVGPFTEAIESGAETVFYRELAQLTRRFVQMEADLLKPD